MLSKRKREKKKKKEEGRRGEREREKKGIKLKPTRQHLALRVPQFRNYCWIGPLRSSGSQYRKFIASRPVFSRFCFLSLLSFQRMLQYLKVRVPLTNAAQPDEALKYFQRETRVCFSLCVCVCVPQCQKAQLKKGDTCEQMRTPNNITTLSLSLTSLFFDRKFLIVGRPPQSIAFKCFLSLFLSLYAHYNRNEMPISLCLCFWILSMSVNYAQCSSHPSPSPFVLFSNSCLNSRT